MPLKIFFSWQSDTPTREGRNLVLRALEQATTSINVDLSVEEAIRDIQTDRDTLNIPGTPPIVDTIFKKIDGAAIFMPDLSFVGWRLDKRPTPNPNVLIEYGWALKQLGHGRMLPVMNTAFGKPEGEAMPFDMRHLRNPLLYECPIDFDDDARKAVRNKLAIELKAAILSILESDALRASLPQPKQPAAFEPHAPADGLGKFRSKGDPLGIADDGFMSKAEDVFLIDGPALWLRVQPSVSPERVWTTSELKKAATSQSIIVPISSRSARGFNFVRAEDGFGLYTTIANHETQTYWVVFMFSTGEIWSCDTYIVNAMGETAPETVYFDKEDIARSLKDYAGCLKKLGIQPPYKWEIGMEGIRGRSVYLPNAPYRRPQGACVSKEIVLSGTFHPDDDPLVAANEFLAKLYDKCGIYS